MNCPNCGKELKKDFCIHCGYMSNGNFVSKEKIIHKIPDIEVYFGEKYDMINRNENTFLVGFLGPLYFGLCKLGIIGVIGLYFNILCYYLTILIFPRWTPINVIFTFIILRCLYIACCNSIYLKFAQIKINKIKKKHPDDFKEILEKESKHVFSLMGLIIELELIALTIAIIISIYSHIM